MLRSVKAVILYKNVFFFIFQKDRYTSLYVCNIYETLKADEGLMLLTFLA